MFQDFGLEQVFYHFRYGIKNSLFFLVPLSVFILFCLKNIQLGKIYFCGSFLGIFFLNFIILLSYDALFGIWLSVFVSLLVVLMIWDFKTLSVPILLNLLVLLLGIFGLFFKESVLMALVEGFALCGILAFMQIIWRLFNKEALGDGDLMLALPLGMVFGFIGGLNLLLIASCLGVIFYLIVKKPMLPFISLLVCAVGIDYILGFLNV